MSTLQTRVDQATKAQVARALRRTGLTESALVRAAVQRYLKEQEGMSANSGRPPVVAPGPGVNNSAGKLKRVMISIPAFLLPEIEARAKEYGQIPSRWISSLVQSHLMNKPVLRGDEITALLESNRELAAVGRNVNQMAKHLNASPSDVAEVRLELLHLMYGEIELLRKSILSLVAASNRVWGNNGDY